jgi:excisionase family DNA binding protein
VSEGREYLRAREIAERTGMSLRTVRRWIAAGTLRSRRLGGARLVRITDLDPLRESATWTNDGSEHDHE